MRLTAKFIGKGFSFVILLLLLVACAATNREVNRKKTEFPPVKQNKPDLSILEKPVMSADFSLLKGRGEKYNLVFRDAPLREVIMTIARDRGINVVFDETVDPSIPVSMDVRGVSFEQALRLVTEPYGVSYILDDNILWIFKGRILTKIFKLHTVNIKRAVKVTSSIRSGGSEAGGEEMPGGTFTTDTQTSNEFNIWDDVGCNICALLNLNCRAAAGSSQVVKLCSDRRKFVAVNRTTGHIIVSATQRELREVEKYIDITEASLKKQVVLDVKIMEVLLSDKFNLGVDWSKVFDNVFRSTVNYSVTIAQNSAPGEYMPIQGFTTFSIHPVGNTQSPFNLMINALREYGDVHVISSPRLAVVNNQAAVIKVGSDMKFVTDVNTETTIEGDTNIIGCDVDTDTYFVGVSLTLTPYVDESGEVTLFIHPNVTELKEVRSFRSECGDVPIEEPVFDVRELDTVVKVRDGDTLVIGGLIKNISSKRRLETPGLSQVPGLGNLFTRRDEESKRAELIIFITPHVIYGTSKTSPNWKLDSKVDILGVK